MQLKATSDCHTLSIAQRLTVCESIFVEKLNTTVRLLLALPDDLEVILDYLCGEHFSGDFDLLKKSIDTQKLKQSLASSQVILATDCFELCGLVGTSSNNSLQDLDKKLNIDVFEVQKSYGGALHKRMLAEVLKQAHKAEYSNVTLQAQNSQVRRAALQLGFDVSKSELDTNGNEVDALTANLSTIDMFSLDIKPTLPDLYKLDQNEQRKQLERFYVKKLDREICFELALPSDIPVFKQYLLNEFMRQTPLTKTLQFSKQTIQELFDHRFDAQLFYDQLVGVATDNGKICGVCTFKPIQVQAGRREELLTELPSDFEKEVEALNAGDSAASQCHAVALWMMQFVPQFLPPDCENYVRMEMMSIHPDFTGYGLGRRFGICNLKRIFHKDYRFVQFLNVAASSNKMLESVGGLNVVSVPFSAFKFKGRPVFPHETLCDGGHLMNLVILDLNLHADAANN